MSPWGFWFLGLIFAALALFVGAAWVFARLWARPSRILPRRMPGDIGLEAEPVTFESGPKRLNAWYVPAFADSASAPTVVLVHGWSSESGQMLPLACTLHHAGFGVLGFDARGHGRSPADGPITLKKFTDDIRAALDYVEGRVDIDDPRLAVVGHSFGAASALLAAAEDQRVGAVVSLSAFSDPVEVTRWALRGLHLPRGPFLKMVVRVLMGWMDCPPERVTPAAQIRRINVPILLAHGARDSRIPATELDSLASAADPARLTRLLVAGHGHRSLIKSTELAEALPVFLWSSLDESAKLGKVA